MSSFLSSVGVFTCLCLYLSSSLPLYVLSVLAVPSQLSEQCIPACAPAAGQVISNVVKAQGRGNNGDLTGTGTNLAIFCLPPSCLKNGSWRFKVKGSDSQSPWGPRAISQGEQVGLLLCQDSCSQSREDWGEPALGRPGGSASASAPGQMSGVFDHQHGSCCPNFHVCGMCVLVWCICICVYTGWLWMHECMHECTNMLLRGWVWAYGCMGCTDVRIYVHVLGKVLCMLRALSKYL